MACFLLLLMFLTDSTIPFFNNTNTSFRMDKKEKRKKKCKIQEGVIYTGKKTNTLTAHL